MTDETKTVETLLAKFKEKHSKMLIPLEDLEGVTGADSTLAVQQYIAFACAKDDGCMTAPGGPAC